MESPALEVRSHSTLCVTSMCSGFWTSPRTKGSAMAMKTETAEKRMVRLWCCGRTGAIDSELMVKDLRNSTRG
jgi:hypothetical protein